jgi:membrane protease YdiL (CAAX protease family)
LTPVPPTTAATTDPADTHRALTDPALIDPALSDPALSDPALSDPALSDPALIDPALTHPVRGRVPRWGSVARPRNGGRRLSTAPLVVVGGLAFLLGRTALGGSTIAVPVLVVGYLVLLAGALSAGEGNADPARRAPLGWGIVLGIGLLGVLGATVVGGPVGDRRVGVVAAGVALLAAVAEEALFRRLLYDRLLRFGVVVAVIGSAVLFAVVHLPAYGLVAMPVDLGAALLLSWQRYASGRWTVPAVTHVVANLLAVT